ncbi:MAG: chemotaxis protein CheA [Acidobacteriaceae bacterium]
MDEIVKEFLQESAENLNSLDQQFVRLDANPGDREILGAVFRTIHTIKGTTGFLGFERLESLTHAGENLLSRLRDGEIALTPAMTNTLLAMVDAVRRILRRIEATESDGTGDEGDPEEAGLAALLNSYAPGEAREEQHLPVGAPSRAGEAKQTLASARPAAAPERPAAAPELEKGVADATVRLDVKLLDQLMDLMGELVLARNQILQIAAQSADAALLPLAQRLNHITSDLRERVTQTRMQPLEQLFNQLPRMVRGISQSCGKKVSLEVSGAETEIDRSIMEAVKDPLTHAVRNALDHGIELPATRQAKGKPETGTVHVSAVHDSGYVIIGIKDDGGGLDCAALRGKAVERGLIDRAAADRLSDAEARELIFLPGFSTAAQISNISGRGVGMDVVRTNIEKIGGSVELESTLGKGTAVRFRIPLTLAILPALMVRCAGQSFAIPQASIVELVRIPQTVGDRVEWIGDTPVYRIRERLLPLIVLGDLLASAPPSAQPLSGAQELLLLILCFGSRQFGLIVDGVEDMEEIVVKPLGRLLSTVSLFSAATVRGDGGIALILDAQSLVTAAGMLNNSQDQQLHSAVSAAEHEGLAPDAKAKRGVLYIEASGRAAVDLNQIVRIEQLSPQQIEVFEGNTVFQYEGRILPLIDLRGPERRGRGEEDAARVSVLLCESTAGDAGVAVERVLDSAEEEIVPGRPWPGRSASAAVMQGAVTHLLDLSQVIERHFEAGAGGLE